MEGLPAKILIVDDEPDIVEFISYNLKSKGYLISTAKDGMEAIKKAKEFKPDLILLDIMMPVKDGMETIRELRKMTDFDDTAIIFLTALSDEKYEIEGLKIGADDYISKPIKPELLATRIGTALRRYRKDEDQEQKQTFGDLEINKTKFTVTYKGRRSFWQRKNSNCFLYWPQNQAGYFCATRYCNVYGVQMLSWATAPSMYTYVKYGRR